MIEDRVRVTVEGVFALLPGTFELDRDRPIAVGELATVVGILPNDPDDGRWYLAELDEGGFTILHTSHLATGRVVD